MSPPDQRSSAPGGVPKASEAAAMLYTAKGGQGCTTTAVALAVLLGRTHPVALVAHNPADVLSIAGRAPVEGATSVPLTTGTNLVLDAGPTHAAAVIHDAGPTLDTPIAWPRPAMTVTYLVTRPCFLALRAALEHPIRPTGVIVLDEPGRAITAHDIEAIVNAPVVATVPATPAIARTVDAGLSPTTSRRHSCARCSRSPMPYQWGPNRLAGRRCTPHGSNRVGHDDSCDRTASPVICTAAAGQARMRRPSLRAGPTVTLAKKCRLLAPVSGPQVTSAEPLLLLANASKPGTQSGTVSGRPQVTLVGVVPAGLLTERSGRRTVRTAHGTRAGLAGLTVERPASPIVWLARCGALIRRRRP